MPIASASAHMELAVPSIAQEPMVGTALFSIHSNCSGVILPALSAPSDCWITE